MPTRAWVYDKNNPTASGTSPGPTAPAPNLTAVSAIAADAIADPVSHMNYPVVGDMPKWNFQGTVTLPSSYGDIRFIHIVIPKLSTSPNTQVLSIPSSKFGSTDFPLAGLVLSYQTENQDRDTITWNYTAEFWVENQDGVWTPSPPTTPVTVVGTAAPFGGGTAPPAPTIPGPPSATATAYNTPYGNLWMLGFKVTWSAPAGDYYVRVVKISPAARSIGGLPQQATIDTVQGPFTASQAVALSGDAVDSGQLVIETWTIRLIPINADNVAGTPTDIPCIATPSTISGVTCSEVGPRTNIIPDDPSASVNRGLLTTIKFTPALSVNEGGTTWPQQLRVWMRYDRGSGANVETILLGSFPVVGTGVSSPLNDALVPSVWVSIKNMSAPNQFKIICAIWASDSMPCPAETSANTGSFMMDPPAVKQPASNTASVDFVEYPEIPGGHAWRWHKITVTGVPFSQAEFKALEFTVQKVATTGALTPASDAEGLERTFAGSGASQTPYLNIDVDYVAGIVTLTLLTAWDIPPKTNLDGTANTFRRYLIRVKNVRQDNSKTVVSCWPSGAGPSSEITYAVDRMEITPLPDKAGTNTGGTLGLTFSGPDTNVQVFYTASLMAFGGVQPYVFSTTGTLPPGLTLNAGTGQISGTPTTAGTYNFTGKVTDNAGTTTSLPCTIVVTASGAQVGLNLTATVNAISYQNWANAIVPVFSGIVNLPTTNANYASMTAVWVYAVSPAPNSVATKIQELSNWGGATGVPFSGWDSSIVCTAVDQNGWSLLFQAVNSSGVAVGPPYTTSTAGGVPIVIKAQSSTTLNLISTVNIAETGAAGTGSPVARYQNPPGGNTYTYVTATVTYAGTQNTIPVFSIWHSFNGGATKLWYGWAQGKVGTNIQTTTLNFFIPLGTSSYQIYVAPGTTQYGDPVPANITTSNTLTLSLGAPSANPGGSPILSATNYVGVAATQSNIFMGSNTLSNPWAEVIIKCATPGNADTSPYYYELWIAWTDASGNLVSPGGVANYFGWIRAWEFPNDGSVGSFDDKINYPEFDYYLEFRVYGRTRNSVGGTPPFAGDTGATAMQWPGGATYFRLHVGLPPGTPGAAAAAAGSNATITTTTNDNTNLGLSILSNPSFESSIPGQINGVNNSSPGPGYLYPGWAVDTQTSTSYVTILGTGGHSGANFARLTGPSTVIKQGFSVAPQLPIYIQFYFQSSNTGGTNHSIDVTLFYLNASFTLLGQSSVGSMSNWFSAWSPINLIIKASDIPAGCNLGILAFKTHFAELSSGYWDIDDVIVQQVVNQTNSGQGQSMGADSVPVGLHNKSITTIAESHYGLDNFFIKGTGGANISGAVGASNATLGVNGPGSNPANVTATPSTSGVTFAVMSPSSQNGIQINPTTSGNQVLVYQGGAGYTAVNAIAFKDADGIIHVVRNGIITTG